MNNKKIGGRSPALRLKAKLFVYPTQRGHPATPRPRHCERSEAIQNIKIFLIFVLLMSGLGEGSFLLSSVAGGDLTRFCGAKPAACRRVRERLNIRLQTRERKCLFLGTGIQFKKKKPAATYFPAFAVSSA